MRTKFNKNGTVSITGISKDAYFAIRTIVMAAQKAFDEPEDDGEYRSNEDFFCCLEEKEIEELNKIDWLL